MSDGPKFPVRTEVTVLGPDDPNQRTVNWRVKEYEGSPIGKNFDAEGHLVPLTREDDLKEGDVFYSPAMFTRGYHQLTARRGADGEMYGENDGLIAFLEFDGDDRHCWTSWGYANAKSLKKVTTNRDE